MRYTITIAAIAASLFAGVSPGQASDAVRCVQESVTMLGYPARPFDGILGPRTKQMAREFAQGADLDMPALTSSNAQMWCDRLRHIRRGAEIHAGDRLAARPETNAPVCVDDPPESYTRTIEGMADGDPYYLRVSNQFAGAVDSLVWRGKQFINIFDHGRQISYAWQMDRHGECYNPTEPGNQSDLFAATSTSRLEQVCSPDIATLTTRNRPAFWTEPGETAFCDNGTTEAINTTAVSDQIFNKKITLGYQGIENVIAFDATVTTTRDHGWMGLEMPTAYLNAEFSEFLRFDPATGQIDTVENQGAYEPFSFVNTGGKPPIIATPDGNYALGAFGLGQVQHYELLRYETLNPHDANSKWNIIYVEEPAPQGDYRYRSFAVIGSLDDVRRGLMELAKLHPIDTAPPEGYVGRKDCEAITGWAWDADLPDQPIEIAFNQVMEDGSKRLIRTRKAGRFRPDLLAEGKGNGKHGFSIRTDRILGEEKQMTVLVEAVNPDPNLRNKPLIGGTFQLRCSE